MPPSLADKKHAKTAWPSQSSKAEKPWGYEIRWGALQGIGGKLLYINKGCRNSLKLNRLKNECLFVLEGEVEFEYGSELTMSNPEVYPFKKKKLSFGEHMNVQSGCPYRITALSDAQLIEIGSSHMDTDIVRIEDDYGRAPPLIQEVKNK
tara:strand:+ start:2879 stop:3328 length:450 start_codon:yes stop_codon:yes gene_type:complete